MALVKREENCFQGSVNCLKLKVIDLCFREAYKDATSFIQHVQDVKEVAKAAITKFTFVGTKADLDLIRGREYMKNQNISYWELVDGAFWM